MNRADGSEVKEAVYIGLCEHGKARAIVVDDPRYRKDTADFVAEMIRGGLEVKHVEGVEGRAAIQFACIPCDEKRDRKSGKDKKQLGFNIPA